MNKDYCFKIIEATIIGFYANLSPENALLDEDMQNKLRTAVSLALANAGVTSILKEFGENVPGCVKWTIDPPLDEVKRDYLLILNGGHLFQIV